MANVRLHTPEAILSYPNLFVARAGVDGGEPKFSCTLIFDEKAQKTKEFAALKAALKPAAEEKWGTKIPPNLKNPFLEGVKYGLPEGTVFIRVSSKSAPGVVDASVQPIIDPSEIYPGAKVRATLNVYAWEHKTGGKGVSFGLGNIQKVGDGPRLDNRVSASQDFGPVDAGGATGAAAVDDLFK